MTLTNITRASTNATLQFHELKYIDEKDYMCKCNVLDAEDAHFVVKSSTTRILVKGKDIPNLIHDNIQAFFSYFVNKIIYILI